MRGCRWIWAMAAPAAATTYPNCAVLDCATGFTLRWGVDASAGTIAVAMASATASAGWLGIGLSPGSSMVSGGAVTDFVIGAASPAPLARDYSTTAYGQPTLDARQDVTLVAAVGNASTGELSVEWSRALVTGDASDRDIGGGPQAVLWAFNPNAGAMLAADGSTFLKHLVSTRGIAIIDFGAPSSCAPCGVAPPQTTYAAAAATCLGNGWPSAEAGGDRDGGAAQPSGAQLAAARAAGAASVNVSATAPAYTPALKGGAYAVHGVAMVIAWWFIIGLGAVAGRYSTIFSAAALPVAVAADKAEPVSLASIVPPMPASRRLSRVPVSLDDVAVLATAAPAAPQARTASWKGETPRAGGCPALPRGANLVLCAAVAALVGFVAVEVGLQRSGIPMGAARFARWGRHQRVGVTALVALCGQLALGLAEPAVSPALRPRWVWAHRLVSTITLLAGWTAIPLGLTASRIWSGPGVIIVAAHGLASCIFILLAEGILCAGRGQCGGCCAGRSAEVTKLVPGASQGRRTVAQTCSRFLAFLGAGVASAALCAWIALQPVPRPLSGGSFFTGASPPIDFPKGEQTLCFIMPPASAAPAPVPTYDTSYMCRAFAFPPDVPLSALSFVPLLDAVDLVHHMILYQARTDASRLGDARGVFTCSAMPPVVGPMYVWAAGAPAFSTPQGVGFRAGGDTVSWDGSLNEGAGYVILQIHYSNPSRTRGRQDASGVLVRVSSNLQPIDAGLLWLGAQTGSIALPPGRTTGMTGECSSRMTSQLPPAREINPASSFYTVFGNAFHMHTLGKRIWVETHRSGQRVMVGGADQLGHDNAYSFGGQRFLPTPGATLEPGDLLLTRCIFTNTVAEGVAGGNTVAAAGKTVYGGEATTNEMCMAFVAYYPRGFQGTPSCMTPAAPLCDDGGGALPPCASLS
jgi:hypothetical protein